MFCVETSRILICKLILNASRNYLNDRHRNRKALKCIDKTSQSGEHGVPFMAQTEKEMMFKRVRILQTALFIAFILTSSGSWSANTYQIGPISSYTIYSLPNINGRTVIEFAIVGPLIGAPACSTTGYWIVPLDSVQGRAMMATILLAKSQNLSVKALQSELAYANDAAKCGDAPGGITANFLTLY